MRISDQQLLADARRFNPNHWSTAVLAELVERLPFTEAELAALQAKLAAWPAGNPFSESLRQQLRRLGGQHAPSTASNDRHITRDDIACETAMLKREPVSPW